MSSLHDQRLERDFRGLALDDSRQRPQPNTAVNYPYTPQGGSHAIYENVAGESSDEEQPYPQSDPRYPYAQQGTPYTSSSTQQPNYPYSPPSGYQDQGSRAPQMQRSYKSVTSYQGNIQGKNYAVSKQERFTEVQPGRGQGVTRSYEAEVRGYRPNESGYVPQTQTPSPMPERHNYANISPMYNPKSIEKYPEGAPSRLLYTMPVNPVSHGVVQSRPTNPNQTPPPPMSSVSPIYENSSPAKPVMKPVEPKTPPLQTTPPQYSPDEYDNYGNDSPQGKDEPGKGSEAQVDALVNLLMQNMEATSDPNFFGMCSKCQGSIIGENSGCTALDQMFHIKCFLCSDCNQPLGGQPFFALEGVPYCEPCYMKTLEKCTVCGEPITDRILRGTGKPYHPKCFACVVCGKSLDGIPFTVDAKNQIHCIEDFHRKFAPRCYVCHLPILPEPGRDESVRLVAMDRSFHVHCYQCEDCGLQLSSEAEGRACYPLDGHILCRDCNAKRIQNMTSTMTTEL